jgi:hypothetical protein
MALTRATAAASEGTSTTISTTFNIPATATCVWVGWQILDQGTTARTVTVQLDGATMTEVERKDDALSGPAFGVARKTSPATGTTVAFTVSSSPAFNNRQWSVIAIYGEAADVDSGTPNDAPVLTESATATSSSNTTSSAVGDNVLSFVCANGRTAGSTAPSPAPTEDYGEQNGYLGASRTAGASPNVTAGWAWGGTSIIAAQIDFNVNTPGGSTPSPGVGALTLTGTSLGLGFTINMPSEA